MRFRRTHRNSKEEKTKVGEKMIKQTQWESFLELKDIIFLDWVFVIRAEINKESQRRNILQSSGGCLKQNKTRKQKGEKDHLWREGSEEHNTF